MRFVLVHGGFHGAWCWSRTIPELEASRAPTRSGDRRPRATVRPGATKPRPWPGRLDVRDLLVLVAGDVLVGHSGGGLEITRAADAAPELVRHLVYLGARCRWRVG